MSEPTTKALKLIRLDGGTQIRAEINPETVEEYAAVVDELPPVVVFNDGRYYWLADGFHRWYAHERAGRGQILCDVRAGSQRDAILYACGANSRHGLPRNRRDIQRAVLTLLQDEEWSKWSNREIARQCRVDESTVRKYRALVTGTAGNTQVLVRRKGTVYTMDVSRFQRLIPEFQEAVQEGRFSEEEAAALAEMSAEEQREMLEGEKPEDPRTQHIRRLFSAIDHARDYAERLGAKGVLRHLISARRVAEGVFPSQK